MLWVCCQHCFDEALQSGAARLADPRLLWDLFIVHLQESECHISTDLLHAEVHWLSGSGHEGFSHRGTCHHSLCVVKNGWLRYATSHKMTPSAHTSDAAVGRSGCRTVTGTLMCWLSERCFGRIDSKTWEFKICAHDTERDMSTLLHSVTCRACTDMDLMPLM